MDAATTQPKIRSEVVKRLKPTNIGRGRNFKITTKDNEKRSQQRITNKNAKRVTKNNLKYTITTSYIKSFVFKIYEINSNRLLRELRW